MGGVNYRTSGMLKLDKLWNQTATASIILVQLVSVLWHWIGTWVRRGLGSINKGPNATICLVRRQNHAGTTVSWTTVQREKSSHAYKLNSNVQTACSTDSLNNCPKHSILRFSSFALKIYLWLKMCQHNLPCSIVYAHCLLPGMAFASLYVLLFLEKEAEIGGRVVYLWEMTQFQMVKCNVSNNLNTSYF